MINKDQYAKLRHLRSSIVSKTASGDVITKLAALHLEFTGNRVQVHCNVCLREMLNYFHVNLVEFEKGIPAPKRKKK